MYKIRLSNGVESEARLHLSILDSAAQAGVTLEYSCKTGRCSTCKCKVLSGSTRTLHPELGLTELEKKANWILSCVRTAVTDIQLEAKALSGISLPPVKTLPCRISQMDRLAPDVLKIGLRLPPTADFNFIPGQYIDVIGPNGVRRSYSLANADFADRRLELHIREVASGLMSDYWFNQAKLNDLLRLNGPLGTFFLRNTAEMDLIFLATGTGIAPVTAMLVSLGKQPPEQKPKSVTVVWGGRQKPDLYLDSSEMARYATYIPVLSRADTAWTGATGYVQDALISSGCLHDLSNASVYACGSDAMIHSAKSKLVENGLTPSRFFSDAFVCSSTQ